MSANVPNLEVQGGMTLKSKDSISSSDLSMPMGSLAIFDRIRLMIQRGMASPAAYQLAVKSVFTRWFAKKRTNEVFDLMAGFVNFQVLLTCVRCQILDYVQQIPRSFDELSHHTQLPKETLDRLILSAVALGLLEKNGESKYGIGKLGLPVVNYSGIQAMIEHNAVLYADMQDTTRLLKSSDSSLMNHYWPYATQAMGDSTLKEIHQSKQDQFARYSELMSASQNFVIDEILGTYDFSQHKRMLDIGCGKGRFVSMVAQKYAHLKFDVMDLPQVISLTEQQLKEAQILSRVNLHPGSFKLDDLPKDPDLVTLVRVAHDHSDSVVEALLRKIFLSLPPKGTLLLSEPMADPNGAKHDAYFHFYLLAMGEGRLRTPEQLTRMLKAAGFEHVKLLSNPMPIHTRMLVAQKD